MKNIKIGIIGPKNWGSKWINNILKHPNYQISWIVHKDKTKSDLYKDKYKLHNIFLSIEEAMNNEIPDIVLLTTPASTHIELAKEVFKYVSNIIVEKPIGLDSKETSDLLDFCKANKKNIFVDHTYLFDSKVSKIKKMINEKTWGSIINIESIRTNSSNINEENLDVTRYLAIHDLAILDFLLEENPGSILYKNKSLDSTDIYINYKNGVYANISVAYNSSKKIRLFKIIGSKETIIWDDLTTKSEVEPIYLELDHIKDVLLNNIMPINGYDHIKRINSTMSKLEGLLIS